MKLVLKKIISLIITLFIVSLLAFLAFQIIPGDPTTKLLGTNATPEKVAQLPGGLDQKLGRKVWEEGVELSGGQIQRLAIATAIAANPAVLIMDDPTSEMDPFGRRQFFQWLGQVKDTTVFIVTSEIDDLCEVADVVWVLNEGQLVAQGRPGEVFNHLAADWQIPAPTIQQLAQKMDWHLADGRYPVNDAELKEARYVHN